MFIEKEYLEKWMRRIMERFDLLENRLEKLPENNTKKEPEKERRMLNGELLLDNQDLCLMLKVSKRSLQRYRSLKWLSYEQIDQKIYYFETEVEKFINEHFANKRKKK